MYSDLGIDFWKSFISLIKTREIIEVAAYMCIACILLLIVPFPSKSTIKRVSKVTLNLVLVLNMLYSIFLIIRLAMCYEIENLIQLSIWNYKVRPIFMLFLSIVSLLLISKNSEKFKILKKQTNAHNF